MILLLFCHLLIHFAYVHAHESIHKHTHTYTYTHIHTYTYTHEKIQKKSNYPLFLISETKKKYKIDTHMMYKHTSIHKHKPTHSHTHINARGEGRGREKIWIISFIMNAGRALNDSSRASKSCQILPNGLQSVARWCSYHFLPFSLRLSGFMSLNTTPRAFLSLARVHTGNAGWLKTG